MNLEIAARIASMELSDATLSALKTDLAAIPVSAEAAAARCARYDVGPSDLPGTVKRSALLVFSKSNGFRDNPSVNAASDALKAIAARRKWTLVLTEKGTSINERDLRHFDAVVWNNVSGDVLTTAQRSALKGYVEGGGGFAAVHGSGGDPVYTWNWYADTLIGARFIGHPRSPQFQSATVIVDDSKDWIVRGLPARWAMTEEWYSFKASPRDTGAHILARLDEASYEPAEGATDLHMGDHPIAWVRCVGDGRSFYSAIGHRPESYVEPHALRLLERGIAWSAGLGNTRCRNGIEVRVF